MATTVGTRAPCSPDGRQRWRGGGYGPRGRRLVPATRRDGCLEASPRRASARMATPPMASWRDIAELSCTQRALNTPARPGLRAQSLRARGHNVDCTTNGRGRLAGHAAGGTGAALRAAAVRSSSPSPGRRAPTSPTVNPPGGADRRRSRELPLDGAHAGAGRERDAARAPDGDRGLHARRGRRCASDNHQRAHRARVRAKTRHGDARTQLAQAAELCPVPNALRGNVAITVRQVLDGD